VSHAQLPPGQQLIDEFPRFGLPEYVRRWPEVPAHPTIRLDGLVESPSAIDLEELRSLPRYEHESDFHCVTTWTRRGLCWSGYRLSDLYDRFMLPRLHPGGACQ